MIQIKKTILTLVALLAVTTGAWADETLLLTIESKDYNSFWSGSMTFDDKVTVTFSNSVYNDGDNDGWYGGVSLLTVAGTNGYTITSCKFYTYTGIAKTGYTVEGESPSVYLSGGFVYTDDSKSVILGNVGITKIEVYGTASSSGPEVAWDKAAKTGTFKMPGGNVTLEPEYYPQAALTAAPTAINDVPATTDGAIVKAGTVANIGSTETAQGTVMYYVSKDALDDAALLALAADQWTADVPTAEKLAKGEAYVYYYVRGNDSDTDEENFSDGDILAANALQVTLGAAPLWNAEFDLTDAPEADKTGKWSTNIPEGGVTKGQTVTVTYTGSKKVIGVKAEKKAAEPVADIVWDATNVFNSAHQFEEVSPWNSDHLTYEGITISFSGDDSFFRPYGGQGESMLLCYGEEGESFTFTAPSGKKFCKIEIINNSYVVFDKYGDWTQPEDNKIVWSGTAANAVTLGTVYTAANKLNSIAFYLSK